MFSYGPRHMAEQKQDDQLESTYSSSVRIRDVAQRTCQKRWTIGRSGERGSGISVLAARPDDDNDDFQYPQYLLRVFHTRFNWWALAVTMGDSDSLWIPRTLWSILTELNNSMIWMFFSFLSNSSFSLFFNPLNLGPFQGRQLQMVSL